MLKRLIEEMSVYAIGYYDTLVGYVFAQFVGYEVVEYVCLVCRRYKNRLPCVLQYV